jgi:hypothetical protein
MANHIRSQLSSLLRTLGVSLFLQFLSLFAVLFPNYGNYLKRVFFIVATYHELQRQSFFQGITIDKVNEKLLQIKKPLVLTNVSDITQDHFIQFNLAELNDSGVDVQRICSTGELCQAEAILIAEAVERQTPPGLKYGKSAMVSDITHLFGQTRKEA